MENTLIDAKPKTLDPQEHRILGLGVVSMHAYQNVAYPSPGFYVIQLERRGLMDGYVNWDHGHNLAVSRYTVTRAGRDAYVSYGRPYVPITDPAHIEPVQPSDD